MKRSSITLGLGALALLLFIGVPRFRAHHQQSNLTQRLTTMALQSLKDEYDVLVTGKAPVTPLIPHDDEWGHQRSSDERLADVLGRWRQATDDGRPYTSVDVNLEPHDVEVVRDGMILHATELVSLHFRWEGRPSDPARDVTKMKIPHDFVFGPPVEYPVLMADRKPPGPGFQSSLPKRSAIPLLTRRWDRSAWRGAPERNRQERQPARALPPARSASKYQAALPPPASWKAPALS